MKILKWLLKHIWQPLSELFSRILGNHLVQGLLSYFSFKLLETSKANQILANVMLWFAIFAFGLYILEKIFGVKTPLIKIGKIFKPFRSSKLFENPNSLQDNFEMIHQDSKKIYKFIKKKGRKNMKNFIKLIFANKFTLLGSLSAILFFADTLFNLTARWNLPKEWYYTISGALLLFIQIATYGRGAETLEEFESVVAASDVVKTDKNTQKKIKKAQEMAELFALVQGLPKAPAQQSSGVRLTPEQVKELNR